MTRMPSSLWASRSPRRLGLDSEVNADGQAEGDAPDGNRPACRFGGHGTLD